MFKKKEIQAVCRRVADQVVPAHHSRDLVSEAFGNEVAAGGARAQRQDSERRSAYQLKMTLPSPDWTP